MSECEIRAHIKTLLLDEPSYDEYLLRREIIRHKYGLDVPTIARIVKEVKHQIELDKQKRKIHSKNPRRFSTLLW